MEGGAPLAAVRALPSARQWHDGDDRASPSMAYHGCFLETNLHFVTN